jgi:hypothetical protein
MAIWCAKPRAEIRMTFPLLSQAHLSVVGWALQKRDGFMKERNGSSAEPGKLWQTSAI